MEGLYREIRLAVRSLLYSPAYTATVICILAIAIGSAAALFSVMYGVLLRPMPYRDSERLVLVDETSQSLERLSVSYPDLLDWQERTKSFESLGPRWPK
jgi:putative ABC transport system permease protein